jgi:uncharacterized phage-associated protein
MAYPASTIANTFIGLAEQQGMKLTNMQLQKLVYIAHGFYLAIEHEPLLEEDVRAWQWGPVIRELYDELRNYGSHPVDKPIPPSTQIDEAADPGAMQIIRNVWRAYGKLSASQLSVITHQPDTPWRQAWNERPYGYIDNDVIAAYYRNFLHERQPTSQSA